MIWIVLLLLLTGAAYKTAPHSLDGVGIAVIAMIVGGGALWLSMNTGLDGFYVSSWQTLAGVNSAGEIWQNCPTSGTTSPGAALLYMIVILVMIVILFVTGIGAMVLTPVGIIAAVGGSAYSMITRKKEGIEIGLAILGLGLAAVFVAGLTMRVIHAVSPHMC